MKPKLFLIPLTLLFCAAMLFSQANPTGRAYIPFLDKESQTNVIVTVSDVFSSGQPCPASYANVLSNSNLFSLAEQRMINDAFAVFTKVTTNSGPPGTKLMDIQETNQITKAGNRIGTVKNWIMRYQYTNSQNHVDIMVGNLILAKFRDKSNDGYNVLITRSGSGSLLAVRRGAK